MAIFGLNGFFWAKVTIFNVPSHLSPPHFCSTFLDLISVTFFTNILFVLLGQILKFTHGICWQNPINIWYCLFFIYFYFCFSIPFWVSELGTDFCKAKAWAKQGDFTFIKPARSAGFSRIKKIPYQAPPTQLGPQKCTF